jgi:hypothetical protein
VAALMVSVLLLALTTLSLQDPAQADSAKLAGFFSGKLIDPATGDPVHGVTVKVFRINTDHLLGRAKSGTNGRFRIDGLPAADEELDVRVNGSAVHYESGWVACNHTIVGSEGEACTFSQGRQTRFKVEHL